jgi:predicted nucleic acid-binding protein
VILVEVLPIDLAVVERAKEIVLARGTRRSARDAIHIAAMERHGIERILSFDKGFDGVPGVTRIS